MEKSVQKSEEQAEIIKAIAPFVIMLDVDYCKEIASDMKDQAGMQETLTVLNPSYPQTKNEILRMQGNALLKLCEYVEALKEVEKLQKRLQTEQAGLDKVARLFI